MADNDFITKRCYKCKESKPLSNFSKCAREKDGLQCICKPCVNSYTRKNKEKKQQQDRDRYHNFKDKWLDQNFKRKYGITLNDYKAMLNKQGGKCAICGNECPSNRKLAVDHSHKTGIVRGLLCIHCNQAIGHFKDDTSLLNKAIDYLLKRDHMI